MSYRLPAFRLNGKLLVAYGAAANHCAFYPGSVVQVLKAELKNYDLCKGTIRFPAEKPLPGALVRKLVRLRMATDGGQGATNSKPAKSKAWSRKAKDAQSAAVLEAIPNIGASIAQNLRSIGISSPGDLVGRDPHQLYTLLCDRTHARQDPCVLDTFIAAVRFMEGSPARPWWHYTEEKKALLRSVDQYKRDDESRI